MGGFGRDHGIELHPRAAGFGAASEGLDLKELALLVVAGCGRRWSRNHRYGIPASPAAGRGCPSGACSTGRSAAGGSRRDPARDARWTQTWPGQMSTEVTLSGICQFRRDSNDVVCDKPGGSSRSRRTRLRRAASMPDSRRRGRTSPGGEAGRVHRRVHQVAQPDQGGVIGLSRRPRPGRRRHRIAGGARESRRARRGP